MSYFQKMVCIDKKIMFNIKKIDNEIEKERQKIEENRIEEGYFNIISQESKNLFFNLGNHIREMENNID
tara:strand:+ start:118 stop:324 length:207 start_codon:yes stop_codon:yes gene_type:complete